MSGRSPSSIRLQHQEESTGDPGGGGSGGGLGMLAGAEGHKPTPSPKHQRVEVSHYVQTPWAYSPTPAATVHQTTVHQGYQMHQQNHHQQVHHHNHHHHIPYQGDDHDEEDLTFTKDDLEDFGALKQDQGPDHQGQSMQGQGQYYQMKARPKGTPEAPLWVPGESQEFYVTSSPNQQDPQPYFQGHSTKSHSPQGHSPQGHSRSREVNEAKLPEPAPPRYGWEGSSSRMPTISSDGSVMVNTANTGAGSRNVNQGGSRSGSGSGGSGTGFDPSRPSAHSPRGYMGADAVRASGKGMPQQNISRPKDTLTPNAVSYSSPRRPSKMQGYRAGGGPTGFVIDEEASRQEGLGCCGFILTVLSWLLIIITCPFSLCLCIKVVQEYERAVIFRLGRLMSGGAKGPEKSGLFFIIPCMDSYTKVDLRTVSFDVPPQEVLSKDSVTVAVDAVVYYRVQNATISVTNVEDAARSTRLLAATNLRNVLGTKNLSEILADRENISHRMQVNLDEATDPWGVKVERVEIKDVRLPVQLQRAMAAEAEAAREARAKVIAAEGEHKAARALKDAADVIAESPSALQLRYLQTLNTISAEKNSTIIFPLPIDFLKCFMGDKKNQNQIKNE